MNTVRQPARRPAPTSRQRSPIITLAPRSMPQRSAASISMPGPGLYRQPPLTEVQTTMSSSGIAASSNSCIRFISASDTMPRPTSFWLVTTMARYPASRSRRTAAGASARISNSSRHVGA
jgi:hypothetical protein